jgi:hypothetical protein
MPFEDVNSALEPLMFQMKQYKNLTKSTIEILPSSGQTNYGPHQKCIFTLPYASLLSLEDLALHFDFTPANVPTVGTAGATAHDVFDAERVMAPKDVASLIAEIDIKINGQTIQHLTNYNDIVNLMNMFEEAKSAKKVLQNCDPSKYSYLDGAEYKPIVTTDYIAIAGGNAASATNVMKKTRRFAVNHWYGLLGSRGKEVSSNFIDTNMVGEVTIAFTFASPSVLISTRPSAANLTTIKPITGSMVAVTETEIKDAADASRASYVLSDLKMSMVRYNLPMEYSEALRSNLSSGAKYQIAFNHYEIHSQAAGSGSGSLRFNENSKDIKGLIGYFTNAKRDQVPQPSSYDELTNTSSYFKYDNPAHNASQFQIGSVMMPQNELKSEEAFLELTRAVAGARGNNAEFDSKIDSVGKWLSSYFMAYLSLEMTEGMTLVANDNKKLLSGLSSENLPISCVYKYSNNPTIANAYGWAADSKNVNVLALTTRMLVIENGQNCYVEI